MRIAIDIRRINEFGVGTYIWNLVRSLSAADSQNEYLLLGSRRDYDELGTLGPNFSLFARDIPPKGWREHFALPLKLRRQNLDVVHIPHHEGFFVPPGKCVVTVHDCVHVKFPLEGLSRFKKYKIYLRTKRAVETASRVLAVSNSTRDDLMTIFDLDVNRISVIHNALDERFAIVSGREDSATVLERYQLNDPFILYSGRIRPHKNIHRLIEAFAVLKNELAGDERYARLKLIVIGDELSRHQYLRLTVVRSGVQQDVRFFGFVPYATLQVFYQSAALFAFPSLYEGFGLPPLEAMANRTPVLASNTSSLPEVLGDAALLVNPENVFEIARGMKSILTEQTVRDRLVQKGVQQISKFSWKKAALQVIEAYEKTARLPSPVRGQSPPGSLRT
jgi:glycosyltransferase involved in cell wall biosynthesis